MTKTVQKNKMTTKTGHKNKNMILYFEDSCRYRQRIKIPPEIEGRLLAKGINKKPWSGYLLAYVVSFKNPLTDKDVEELTLVTKNSGWTLRQERGELSEDYADSGSNDFEEKMDWVLSS